MGLERFLYPCGQRDLILSCPGKSFESPTHLFQQLRLISELGGPGVGRLGSPTGLEDEVASLASRVERVSSERQEHETLAQQPLASAMELRKELADTQADAAAHAAELEQLQEAHGQLQSDSESHIERQRELTTQAQNELEALRKQLQSAGADHQAAAETLTAEMDALREAKAGLEDEEQAGKSRGRGPRACAPVTLVAKAKVMTDPASNISGANLQDTAVLNLDDARLVLPIMTYSKRNGVTEF